MFLTTQTKIQQAAREFVQRQYGVEANVVVNVPPRSEMGDMALPLAMELARKLRRAPKQIAEEIAAGLRSADGVGHVEVAGAGYVNVFLDRAAFGLHLGETTQAKPSASDATIIGEKVADKIADKIIVEHTNINPNKAAHIGHLRNAALGDTFVRLLRSRGHQVEIQNYIDNTGVQVADVVAGFIQENKTPADVKQLIEESSLSATQHSARFDYYCWDLYARISRYYDEDATRLTMRQKMLQAIEHGGGDEGAIAEMVSNAIVHCHLATMLRLGVVYDVLPRESEILHLHFWDQCFELLKQKGAIYLESEGKNKGCWVMRQKDGSPDAEQNADAAGTDETKVIVRSNGTVTYVGKDIAYQLWKFGLLGRDFYYRPFSRYPGGSIVWVSSTSPSGQIEQPPEFGRGNKVYNVIDVRQSYLQNIVAAGLRALGYNDEADRSIHFSYEMVALSPRTCERMGIELSEEDRARPFVEVSGRKGLGIKADDLIDRLIAEAQREVDSRHPEDPASTREQIARQIAIGALRYFLLKYTCTAIIAFDFQEALSFEGETGPYVQYAVVRARNIFRKLRDEGGDFDGSLVTNESLGKFLGAPEGDGLWQLLYLASQWEAAVEQAIATTEPAAVAKYAFQLAQAFNNFYHRFHILTEKDAVRKALLLWLVQIVDRALSLTLDLLGIEVPAAM